MKIMKFKPFTEQIPTIPSHILSSTHLHFCHFFPLNELRNKCSFSIAKDLKKFLLQLPVNVSDDLKELNIFWAPTETRNCVVQRTACVPAAPPVALMQAPGLCAGALTSADLLSMCSLLSAVSGRGTVPGAAVSSRKSRFG
ncbi:hypothetical protein DNTS_029385 [Danionella cerebrum]|uniref:Uncharacterized protein n=1 Tax=Danionella cerebrum TaxID=2873325 RepID=A0A553RCS9_9TELE|nr:hypothetical protein DNTS_029385 [Danionella translucida]